MSLATHPSHQTLAISVVDASAVGHARRCAVALAEKLGFGETQCGELALIVTEAGTNLLQHAGSGELLIRALAKDVAGVELIALDKGPGMADLARCLQDGYSTGGSRGVGLGSIVRLADHFDIFTREGGGTALVAACLAAPRPPPAAQLTEHGALCIAYPGEDAVGDGWSLEDRGGQTCVLMVDGLGHGPQASEAALAAIRQFEERSTNEPGPVLEAIHRALKGTRGAAGAVATIDWPARLLRFAGIGNIAGNLLADRGSRGMSSHNGILGQDHPRFQEFHYPWPDDGLLVLHSDGVSTRWNLGSYPGLVVKTPSLIAGVLYRDFLRRDDATVLVLRESAAPRLPATDRP
jgi:anti-sigma regulatory factor (Ser/Thr protein kinase)